MWSDRPDARKPGEPFKAAFPTGARVEVAGGQFAGDHGTVIDASPDLRPGSVWVNLHHAGRHLVPGIRLEVIGTVEEVE
ncbi:hypothetical protein [Amycolatopsis anabasis]|uniref:hypothetical protein n=1 Tax=Amycolatopsis anabasis TaxID=1840409 RepID=UPI001C552EA4|nr:hypothetical protein [Amycolatopsis anabasis]